MEKFWKSALAVGGVSAIGAFIFLGLYKEWLKLTIFNELSGEQTYILMIIFLVLTFCSLIAFIFAFIKSKQDPKPSIEQNISGKGIGVISTGDSAKINISKKK